MRKTKKENPICRSFRQDFPEFVARAEALGVNISLSPGRRKGHDRVFWLDGYRQLTGYETRSDGRRFTREDAVRNIDKVLSEIEEDRAKVSSLSVSDRFERIMSEFRQMAPQYRMIGEVRQPNGDRGHCFFMAAYAGSVDLKDVGTVAKAEAKWQQGESDKDHMGRFCDMLEADFARRQAEVVA